MPERTTIERRAFLSTAARLLATVGLGSVGCADAQSKRTSPAELPKTEGRNVMRQVTPAPVQLAIEGEFPSLDGGIEWLNSPPLTPTTLRGNVVLVNFWTYTCINWLRTVPYVRAWAQKYRDKGLVVVGVHTPEFAFEQDVDNVRRAVREMSIEYPVVIDNKYAVWNAFGNHYWPALYFLDAQGRIRHHQFGEGDYEPSEAIVQQLLAESGVSAVDRDLVSVDARGVEAAADWGSLQSLETYLGYERAENFASPGGAVNGRHVYTTPAQLKLNQWALSGDWSVQKQSARLNEYGGRITYRFHARDLHLVLGPVVGNTSVRFRVLLDGRPPGGAHGVDVDDEGNGTVTDQRLYQLIRQPRPIAERQFEIEFLDSGAEAFAFTFG